MKMMAVLFAGALSLVSAASFAGIYQPKDNEVVIHYFRPDGAYGNAATCQMDTCWGVHTWGEAYEYEGAWTKPTYIAGTDDFGGYYILDRNSDPEMFKTALGRFIIHKGQLKDQSGKDQSWEVKDSGPAIYVVNNDCTVYFKLEDAMAAKANLKNDCKEAVTY